MRTIASMAKRYVARTGEVAFSGSMSVDTVCRTLFQERLAENHNITAEHIGLKRGKLHFLADGGCSAGSRQKVLLSFGANVDAAL